MRRPEASATLELTVPEGIPTAIPISDFAAALNVAVRTVRGWADSGSLPILPAPGKKRYIATEELLKLEAQGWPVNWEVLLERQSV